MRKLVETGYETARAILTEKREQFEALAKALLEYETLSGEEIIALLAGKKPVRDSDDEPSTPRGSPVPSAGRPRPQGGEPGLEPQPQA